MMEYRDNGLRNNFCLDYLRIIPSFQYSSIPILLGIILLDFQPLLDSYFDGIHHFHKTFLEGFINPLLIS